MRRAWERYAAFLSEAEDPSTLAAVRFTFGVALALNVLQQVLLGDPVLMYADVEHGGIFALEPRSLSLFRFLPPTAAVAWALLGVQLLAAMGLAVGFLTRFSTAVAFIIQVTLVGRMAMFRYDGDVVFRVVCFLLLVSPVGAAWSVDAWRGRGHAMVSAWPRRLLVAQLAIIYTRTGVVKLASTWSAMEDWSAVYLALNLPAISRYPGDWAAHPLIFPLTQVATFVASWWEVLFFLVPLNMFLRRRPAAAHRWRLARILARHDLRPGFVLVGLAMHGGLLVVTDVGLFSVVMLSLYPALLLPGEARRVLGWLARKGRPHPTDGNGL